MRIFKQKDKKEEGLNILRKKECITSYCCNYRVISFWIATHFYVKTIRFPN